MRILFGWTGIFCNSYHHLNGEQRMKNKMHMSETDFRDYDHDHAGYCIACNDITQFSCEPDAMGYNCPECNQPKVMGVEMALVMDFIVVISNSGGIND
jgi:hypothetical protein